MLEKIRKKLRESFIDKEKYNYVLEEITSANRMNILILSSICTAIFSILIFLAGFGLGPDAKDIPVFLAALLYSVSILLLVNVSGKNNYIATLIATYMTMAAVMAYGIIISYRSPDNYTVTFIAMICITSMTFIDRPIRIGIAHILVTLICVGMICMHKTPDIMVPDLINVISFSLLSFIGGLFTVNAKVHGYVMDKLHKEDIERGRKRLNLVETEAYQLLTAVQSTHDMIVSVNLTQNTYKLIGRESFVTQGDEIDGVFDEVISVHASKVVEAHREMYLNTFSRARLLEAHAAGKREVYLEYQQCDKDGIPHWLGTHTMFIVDPRSTDVTEITISQNIDERVRKEAETKAILEAERDRAEQAQKAKTDFLFQMSHDIRTPMNAIIGFANFIKSSDDLYTIHNDYVKKLETASQQLLMLINDALEMSRIESGKLVFHREIQDIRATVNNVMSVMQIQADEKGISLESDFSVEHPIVNCDQNHMSRVVMNLLSNAVKFTPPGGRVKVSLYEIDGAPEGETRFELKIADTGVGMSREFLERVFEPFEREKTSTASGMQGTGLGLAIVKRIVDTAGDKIEVESMQGVGTTFTITLTLMRADSEALEHTHSAEDALPPVEEMSQYFKGKRLLLVEDNEFNLTIAETLLENAGFTVETASNGLIAVNKVMAAPGADYYNVILMDVQMPIMGGYEATRKIRALGDERSNTVILALTANAFDTDKENAAEAGMNGHIAKPIDVALLYKTLWDIL